MDLTLDTQVFVEYDTALVHGYNAPGKAPKYSVVHIRGDGTLAKYKDVFQKENLTLCPECFPPAVPVRVEPDTPQPRYIIDPTGRYDFRKSFIAMGDGSKDNPYQLKYYNQWPNEQLETD